MFVFFSLSCAGFGVCCQHVVTTSNTKVTKNGTLVQNPEFPQPLNSTTPFIYMVGDIADDVCFIRLDFQRFELRNDYVLANDPPARIGDCIDTMEIV